MSFKTTKKTTTMTAIDST